MTIVQVLAMMDELDPLTDREVMDSVHGHVSLAWITARDLVNSRL